MEIVPFRDPKMPKVNYALRFRVRQTGKTAIVGLTKAEYDKIARTRIRLQKEFNAAENKALAIYQEMVSRMNGAYEDLTEKAEKAHEQEDTEKAFQIRKQ